MSTNVALNKSNTRVNSYAPYDSATKATDGVLATVQPLDTVNSLWFYQTAHSVTIDLGTNYVLSYVRWYYEVWLPASVPCEVQVVIRGSTDNLTFTPLGTFNQITDWNNANGLWWTNNLAVAGTYRWVMFDYVTNGGGNVCATSEFEVYGTSLYNPVTYLKIREPRNRFDFTKVSGGMSNYSTTNYLVCCRGRDRSHLRKISGG